MSSRAEARIDDDLPDRHGLADGVKGDADAAQVNEAESATAEHDQLYLSARNLSTVKVLPAAQFNAYTVLRQKRLVLTRAALDELRKTRRSEPS